MSQLYNLEIDGTDYTGLITEYNLDEPEQQLKLELAGNTMSMGINESAFLRSFSLSLFTYGKDGKLNLLFKRLHARQQNIKSVNSHFESFIFTIRPDSTQTHQHRFSHIYLVQSTGYSADIQNGVTEKVTYKFQGILEQ